MLRLGAHSCAQPVHTDEEKRPSLLAPALITDSFESRHQQEERSPCLFTVDNSTPSPAHAHEPVCRNAGRVVPKPLLCVADSREAGRSRLPSDDQGKVLSFYRAAAQTSTLNLNIYSQLDVLLTLS